MTHLLAEAAPIKNPAIDYHATPPHGSRSLRSLRTAGTPGSDRP
jgi:hypothetical protein